MSGRWMLSVESKSIGSIGAKRGKLSDVVLPKIILYPSTVNFSFPRFLLAWLFSPLISYWCDSNLKRPPICLSKLNVEKTSDITAFTLYPYAASLLFRLSTCDAFPSDLDTRLLFSQNKEEHSSSPDCNTTCTQSTAKEACNLFTVIYSLQQEEHQRIQLRWSPASLEEPLHHSMRVSPFLTRSLSLSLIFWGWV